METPIRKNYRNTVQQMSDIDQVEAESVLPQREESSSRLARGIRWIPRWISFRSKNKVISLFIVVAIAGGVYGVYEKFFNLSDAERAQKELAAAVAAISKHMILPEGDEPVLATVTDAETLKAGQPFFNGAINGDQLLLFPASVKAVIYSPSRNRIVNMGPIQQEQTAATSGAQAKPTTTTQPVANPVTVEVRNGSGQNGLGSLFAEQIAKDNRYSIAGITDAKSNNYAATVVVDITKKSAGREAVNALAVALGAVAVSELPKGEASSNADVVIIIGNGDGQ